MNFFSHPAEEKIFDAFVRHAARQPDRPAILASRYDPLSWNELVAQIVRMRQWLGEAGISDRSRVGLALPNGPEAVILTVAIAANATCVPLNSALPQAELEEELARFGLDALVVPDPMHPAARAAADNACGLFEVTKAGPLLTGLGLRSFRPVPDRRTASGTMSSPRPALVLRTSGTTGTAKLVPVTDGNLLAMASKMSGWFGLSANDRAACVLPTYYAHGCKTAIIVPLLLGGSVAMPTVPSPGNLADWISDLEPTWIPAGPMFVQAVLDGLRVQRWSMPRHSLRFILAGTAHLRPSLRAEAEALLEIPILETYGSSEVGMIAANPAPPARRKPGTAGLIPRGELEIRGTDGGVLAAGDIGEIFVRGPSVMPGYIGDGEPVGAGLQNGWLPTGDLGSVDGDGFLAIAGRAKEMINRGGEKVSPHEVEKALLLHPAVREAAVFGVPHPRLGENVAAAVVLRSDATATASELRTFVRDRLAAFKVPQRIDIMVALPRGDTGKVSRTQLAQAAVERERRIDVPETPLEAEIVELWRKLLRRSDIGIHDDFFELGGDSLLATTMVLEVEEMLDHRIPQSALAEASTIRGLAAIVVNDHEQADELVTRARDGTATPFFFCHGDYSTRGFYALKLAALLGPDQPVYLLHPWRNVDERFDLTIEAMARSYVHHLLAIQPGGRFRLGGFCNGGLLAWEIAHQLVQAGRQVEFVAAIESLSLNSRRSVRALYRLLEAIAAATFSKTVKKRFTRGGMPAIWQALRQSDESVARRIADSITRVGRSAQNRGRRIAYNPIFDSRDPAYFRAMVDYFPPKVDCHLVCLTCQEHADLFEYAPAGWTSRARAVTHETIAGEHNTCVTTHVAALAESLNAYLAEQR